MPAFNAPRISTSRVSPTMMLLSADVPVLVNAYSKIAAWGFMIPDCSEVTTSVKNDRSHYFLISCAGLVQPVGDDVHWIFLISQVV
jgi:hypothetical protein